MRDDWEKLANSNCILHACAKGIEADCVTYIVADGSEETIEAGTILLVAGMKLMIDLALTFYAAASQFLMIGACSVAGDIQKPIRSAFSTASML